MIDTNVIIVVFVAAVVALLFARVAAIERRLNRLSRLDAKVDAVLKPSGITFDEYANVPPDVADLIRRGETIHAIKRFRRVTGLGLKEAKDYIDEVKRRSGRNKAASIAFKTCCAIARTPLQRVLRRPQTFLVMEFCRLLVSRIQAS